MTPNKSGSPAEEVLAVLEADATLIEHCNPAKIEELRIADIRARLVELELSSSMPTRLKDAIRSSVSPPTEVLSFLAKEPEKLGSLKEMPSTEVKRHLRELGINYRAGAQQILDLVQARAPEPRPRKISALRAWLIKIETVASRFIAILISIGNHRARTAWALPIAVFTFVVLPSSHQETHMPRNNEYVMVNIQEVDLLGWDGFTSFESIKPVEGGRLNYSGVVSRTPKAATAAPKSMTSISQSSEAPSHTAIVGPSVAPETSQATPTTPGVYHFVKAGESLSSIAQHYRVSATRIAKANRIPGDDLLQNGRRLFIPLVASAPTQNISAENVNWSPSRTAAEAFGVTQ
jgi:LysM repeat protein